MTENREFYLDMECAKQITPIVKPGAIFDLVLWPKDGLGPAELVNVKCSWEMPFTALRESDYHCDGRIGNTYYDFKLFSLDWPQDKNLCDDLPRSDISETVPRLRYKVAPTKKSTSTMDVPPKANRVYSVFRSKKDER